MEEADDSGRTKFANGRDRRFGEGLNANGRRARFYKYVKAKMD